MNAHHIFIISGPSGAGEDSVIAGLNRLFDTETVHTTTTREPRKGEGDGNPYFFVSYETFQKSIEEGRFIEWAEQYNGNLYGITKEEFERIERSGKIAFWKIDYKGVISAKKLFPNIVAILLTAPLHTLESRIRRRDNPGEDFIRERMEYTKEWLKHTDIYDYTIENTEGKLEETIEQAARIIRTSLEEAGRR